MPRVARGSTWIFNIRPQNFPKQNKFATGVYKFRWGKIVVVRVICYDTVHRGYGLVARIISDEQMG